MTPFEDLLEAPAYRCACGSARWTIERTVELPICVENDQVAGRPTEGLEPLSRSMRARALCASCKAEWTGAK